MTCSHHFVIKSKGSRVFPTCKLCGKRKLLSNVYRPNASHFRVQGKARQEQQERLEQALREAE